MRGPALLALVGLLLAPGVPAAAPFDALLGVVEGRTIAASDIALARALGVLGFASSSSPITRPVAPSSAAPAGVGTTSNDAPRRSPRWR